MIAGNVDRDALVEPVDGALDRLEAFPDAGARLGRGAAADRPGAGEMVIDLAAHHQRLAADGVGKVGRARGRGVGDDGQRSLERVGEVAGVPPRFLGLRLAMGEQLVDFLGQRPDFRGKSSPTRVLSPERIDGDFAADAAQRPQPVEGLQRGQDQQANAEREEAPEQGRAQPVDLLVDHLARLRDLEAPADVASRAGSRRVRRCAAARHVRGREFVAVVEMRLDVVVVVVDAQPAVPQRARREGVGAGAADLEIEARIRLDEPLVGGRAVEPDFAVGPISDAAIIELRTQHELVVEIVDDRARQHPVEREAADQQQRHDPQRRDADHAPGQRAGPRAWRLSAAARLNLGRRRHRGGFVVQLAGSSRL